MNRLLIFLMLGMAYAQSLTGCPTCIGRLELQSPAFFSDELYQLDPEDDIAAIDLKQVDKGQVPGEDDEDD